MRLICAFEDPTDESILNAYKQLHVSWTRQQLDGRNSDARAPDFYDLIVEKFNDTTWVPKSQIVAGLHPDFEEEHEWPKRSGKLHVSPV